MKTLDILFDGPPNVETGRFIDVVSTETGCGVTLGEWIELPEGIWALRVPDSLVIQEENKRLRQAIWKSLDEMNAQSGSRVTLAKALGDD